MTTKDFSKWTVADLPRDILQGDMPGDRIKIGEDHIAKAQTIFPLLMEKINALGQPKTVVSVYGGSGVGKSETASLLSTFLRESGIGAYTMSGDNYAHRIPKRNDAEREHVYAYGGENGLREYLGSEFEINFKEVNEILRFFHEGRDTIFLRRMGRADGELWYEPVDFSNTQVLVLEWTHGNNDNLIGVDIPVFLASTPAETLAHRIARNRDGSPDSPFVTLVLGIEQDRLTSQVGSAQIIISKAGDIITADEYLERIHAEKSKTINNGPMLNAYPDSIGGDLSSTVSLLKTPELEGAFSSMYILPSLYTTDLDRGFSVQSYDINGEIATEEDIRELQKIGISLKLDFILNHLSVRSPQFRDLLARGYDSEYRDFFIDWNAFWKGYGDTTEEGYIQPDPELIKDMFFRKPGLPILMVTFPDGSRVPYWNTFYQEIIEQPDGSLDYLGQMDLNIESPLVWEHYDETLKTLADYGAEIVRLDAFAYAPKAPGRRNFLNEPETWDLLQKVQDLADKYGLSLLPEIHATYGEGIYKTLAAKGYHVYDFFLPGLLIDAIESGNAERLAGWAKEIVDDGIHTVNMLGCHDGIPMLDLKGLIPEERIGELIEILKARGGFVKDLHGQKNMYYQVNSTYFSALGGEEDALLLARQVQIFMPGKPQVWYLDLLAGENDYEAVKRAGAGGHKEINRTNLTMEQAKAALEKDVVKKQLALLKFRNSHPAFAPDADICVAADGPRLEISWQNGDAKATLTADLTAKTFDITY